MKTPCAAKGEKSLKTSNKTSKTATKGVRSARKLRIEVYSEEDYDWGYTINGFYTIVWYFRIKSPNNQIIAQSEGYTRKASAIKTAKLIAKGGEVVEV